MKFELTELFQNDEVKLYKITWRTRGKRQRVYEVMFEHRALYSYLSGGAADAMARHIQGWRTVAPQEDVVVDTLWTMCMASGPLPMVLH